MTTYARGKKWAEAGKQVNERRNANPEDRPFQLTAEFGMTGDQPAAVGRLAEGVEKGIDRQSLMGVTGSGKTFTMANIVQQVQRPTLVMAHNKTLAAQLAQEFKEFFPHNAVEYFVSYYDYYQPEAYVPQSDTYIEKDSSVNEELDKLRLSATTSLLTRRDVLIVASVSCIYGLGDPQDYFNLVAQVKVGEIRNRSQLVRQLVDMQYDRNDLELSRAKFRVRGDVLELVPAYEEAAVRIQFFGDEVERIVQLDPLTGEMLAELPQVAVYPANHFVTTKDKLDLAVAGIREELEWRLRELRDSGKILEAARLESRTNYDVEMLQETGFCSGVENYAPTPFAAPCGQRPLDPARLFPRGLSPVCRRVSHDLAPGEGYVPRRHFPQEDSSRVRLPPAVGPRQPTTQLRRVRGPHQPGRLRLGHPGPLRTPAQPPGRGAGHSPNRPARPNGRGAAHPRPDR